MGAGQLAAAVTPVDPHRRALDIWREINRKQEGTR